MAKSGFAVFGGILVSSVIMLVACTGDAPELVRSEPGADGGGPMPNVDGSTPTVPVQEAGSTCTAPLADCNSDGVCETSLDTDPKNCGACKHSCGGGLCTTGKCQPFSLMINLTNAVSAAVNDTAIVVLSDKGPHVCPKTGCAGALPTVPYDGVSIASGPNTLYLDGEDIYWLGRHSVAGVRPELMKCSTLGCMLNAAVVDEEQFGAELHGEGKQILRYESQGMVTRLGIDTSPVTKEYLTKATVSDSLHFALSGGKIAFSNSDSPTGLNRGVWGGTFANVLPDHLMNEGEWVAIAGGVVFASRHVDGTNDAIFGCPFTGCGGIGIRLGLTGAESGTGHIKDMIADTGSLYWVESIGTTGRVMKCALPACAGGPIALASAQDNPVAITLDADFVYWVNQGKGGATGTVMAIAK